jgi:hypothetical protein
MFSLNELVRSMEAQKVRQNPGYGFGETTCFIRDGLILSGMYYQDTLHTVFSYDGDGDRTVEVASVGTGKNSRIG